MSSSLIPGDSGGVMAEGFLCPLCKRDFGNKSQLEQHFEVHTREDDKDVLQQIKGIFGKAKKLFNKTEDEKDGSNEGNPFLTDSSDLMSPGGRSASINLGFLEEPQELGQTRSHVDTFKAARSEKVDQFVVEGNKLIIRLEKLTKGSGTKMDSSKRKELEQRVVSWVPDDMIKSCLTCGRGFGLFKARKHHCRLCGGIMCENCSHFIPEHYGKRLISGSLQHSGEEKELAILSHAVYENMGKVAVGPSLRICKLCREVLEQKAKRLVEKYCKPAVVELYEKLRETMIKLDSMLPEYVVMAESLRSGEVSYSITQAQNERDNILQQFNLLDTISKRVVAGAKTPGSVDASVRQGVRSYASLYLQTHMLSLQNLPTEEQLSALRARKEAERKARIRRELATQRVPTPSLKVPKATSGGTTVQRSTSPARAAQAQRDGSTGVGQSGVAVSSTGGWKPAEGMTPAVEDRDPMIQQMNNIKAYIKQARQAEKWDELVMLEDNLKCLQEEYWQMQKKQVKG